MSITCEAPTRRATDMAKKAAKKAARPVGRPPKDASEVVKHSRSAWFTDEQFERVRLAVEKSGLTMTDFLRQAAIEKADRVLGE